MEQYSCRETKHSVHDTILLQDLRLAIVEGVEKFAGTLVQQHKKLGYYIADYVRFDIILNIDISLQDLLDHQSDLPWMAQTFSLALVLPLGSYSVDNKGSLLVRLMCFGARGLSNSTRSR